MPTANRVRRKCRSRPCDQFEPPKSVDFGGFLHGAGKRWPARTRKVQGRKAQADAMHAAGLACFSFFGSMLRVCYDFPLLPLRGSLRLVFNVWRSHGEDVQARDSGGSGVLFVVISHPAAIGMKHATHCSDESERWSRQNHEHHQHGGRTCTDGAAGAAGGS